MARSKREAKPRSANAPADAALGFTVKSGWACCVLLAGPPDHPRALETCRVEISDPDVPESRQPYHEGFGTARGAGAKLSRLLKSVETHGRKAVTEVIERHRAQGHALRGAGIVVGSLIDPATIANDHIRIHALEGQLFRGVVHDAATSSQLPCSIWRERDLYGVAHETLARPEATIRTTLTSLGRSVEGSWRAEHKAAALAAWLVLAKRP
jgi:hypothetical protein